MKPTSNRTEDDFPGANANRNGNGAHGATATAPTRPWTPATPEEACRRVRGEHTPVTGPPVVLVSLYDGQMNISIRFLYAALVGAGHDVRVIRFGHTVPYKHQLEYSVFQTMRVKFPLARPAIDENDVEEFVAKVKEIQPTWVGFNVVAPHNHVARRLTERLRAVTDAPVIWGGYTAINEPEFCLQYADAVCAGEGEHAVVEITEAIKRGEFDPSRIAGMAYRDDEGRVRKTAHRPLLQADDIEAIPLIFYERTPDEILIPHDMLDWYTSQDMCDGGKSNSARIVHDVLLTRGCFFTCSFCFHAKALPAAKGQGKYYRQPSPAFVVEYLKDAKYRIGKTRILFWEDIFPFQRDWVEEFAVLYKREINLPFTVNFHPKLIDFEVVDLLMAAGMDSCNIGFQSGSERVRRALYNRQESNEEILVNAREMAKRVCVCYDLIIDNPYETADDLRASLDLYLQFPHPFMVDTNTLLYFRDHPLTNRALEEGKIREEHILGVRNDPGYEDVTCTSFLPRTDPEMRALTMLIVATQYEFIPKEKLKRWSEDPELLADDRLMSAKILQELYDQSRRMMYEYEFRMMNYFKELNPSVVTGI